MVIVDAVQKDTLRDLRKHNGSENNKDYPVYFQGLRRQELEALLLPLSQVKRSSRLTEEERLKKSQKRAAYRARQIFHWVYQRYVTDWDEMSDLSKELREWLKQHVRFYSLKSAVPLSASSLRSEDGTHKFLWKLADGKTIESVIIPAALSEKSPHFKGKPSDAGMEAPHWKRLTACISSQVGCAMACKFCLTGVQGLDRHLKAYEIVTQVYELCRRAPLTNVVFMGMGEPLHNVDEVIRACQILLDSDGLKFSKRKVTVSTSGLVPQIERLGKETGVSLAVSLNATTDEQRSKIMPVNRRWNIAELLLACKNYPLGKHRRVTYEYVLLKDFNDSLEDAARLYNLLKNLPAKINLIPFNPHSGSSHQRPDPSTIKAFQHYLVTRGMTATVRISRGQDILAACGQLRSLWGTARGLEKHQDAPVRA